MCGELEDTCVGIESRLIEQGKTDVFTYFRIPLPGVGCVPKIACPIFSGVALEDIPVEWNDKAIKDPTGTQEGARTITYSDGTTKTFDLAAYTGCCTGDNCNRAAASAFGAVLSAGLLVATMVSVAMF